MQKATYDDQKLHFVCKMKRVAYRCIKMAQNVEFEKNEIISRVRMQRLNASYLPVTGCWHLNR
jgi:hypothetical protein